MLTPEEIHDRVTGFPERCRAAGLKLTPQRMAVYAVLAGLDSHPTPESIYAAVRGQLNSISQGTVYKILDLLTSRGLLSRVATRGQAARYDARTDPHCHAVCTQCGGLTDMEAPAIGNLPVGNTNASGFQVNKIDVLIEGICRDCRAPASA